MPIFSARHKCPRCGREWTMPVNSADPSFKDREKSMKDGKERLPTVCEDCRRKA